MTKLRYIVPKEDHNVFGRELGHEIAENLGIGGVKVIKGVRYQIKNADNDEIGVIEREVLVEAPINELKTAENLQKMDANVLAVSPLTGQYDQRADFATQCAVLATGNDEIAIESADLYVIEGADDTKMEKIIGYLINPIDEQLVEAFRPLLPQKLEVNPDEAFAEESAEVANFAYFGLSELQSTKKKLGLTMIDEDMAAIQAYFRDLGRNPNQTELKVLDMYWSDHCRHTTFHTELKNVEINGKTVMESGKVAENVELEDMWAKEVYETLKNLQDDRKRIGRAEKKPFSLMELATAAMRIAKFDGKLEDLEKSEEVNAASVEVPVKMADGSEEMWLFMFKNETHNHPTEISPYGGASTALGGCIRDPLSGRSYVFFGMRYVGTDDPTQPISDTISGKLSQRQINKGATEGFAAYGNQIGVPTMINDMVVHPGYAAKRFCCGVTGAAARKSEVVRGKAEIGDVILLIGGRTGRDGIGGATGSSVQADESTTSTASAEVQKGAPPEERALQRAFLNPEFRNKVKVCNDFGAGGVTNAMGELADGVEIEIDKINLKYDGLTPAEIALSESQERMAVLCDTKDAEKLITLSKKENVEAYVVAKVVAKPGIHLNWKGKNLCSLPRDLLEGGWSKREQDVSANIEPVMQTMEFIDEEAQFFDLLKEKLADKNVASKKGIQMRFDSSVGANSVFQPFGGATQNSPSQVAMMRFPHIENNTAIGMASGFDPDLTSQNPYLGGMMAVVQSVSKLVAVGINPNKIRLTLQNYFGSLGLDKARWSVPFLAQMGAYKAQKAFDSPAIGGKDSMSGTFMDRENDERIDVPPTLVSFAVGFGDTRKLALNHATKSGQKVYVLPFPSKNGVPDLEQGMENYKKVYELITNEQISCARAIEKGGAAVESFLLCVGNNLGIDFEAEIEKISLFEAHYGGIIFVGDENLEESGLDLIKIGEITNKKVIQRRSKSEDIEKLRNIWQKPLENLFPSVPEQPKEPVMPAEDYNERNMPEIVGNAKPKVLLPIVLGTNCEIETARAFELTGAEAEIVPFRNKNGAEIAQSLENMAKKLRESQILMLSGGFSAGDQPDGSGKFITNLLKSEKMRAEVENLLGRGLILGVCNGFQALMKSGLLPYGEFATQKEDSPTLAWNRSGHFQSFSSNHRVKSVMSPWMSKFMTGDMLNIPIAHGEGRFVANEEYQRALLESGQVALQYADDDGNVGEVFPHNPNGSVSSIAGITDKTGRILGMMAHPERAIAGLRQNTPFENLGLKIIAGGVDYMKGA